MESLAEKIKRARIIAVLAVDEPADSVELAKALCDGGISAIEMTLRTPRAFECASAIAESGLPITLGIGTILMPEQAREAKKRGAEFGVAPGCNIRVIDAAREAGLPFAPGIMTPSDIEQSLEHGCKLMKFFPAGSAGGLKHLKNISAPYKHLGISFIPLGGLNLDNMKEYLDSPLVAAIGGSWIAPTQLIKDRNWAQIRANAEMARNAE